MSLPGEKHRTKEKQKVKILPSGTAKSRESGNMLADFSGLSQSRPGIVGILSKKYKRFCSKMSKGTCNMRKRCV